MKTDNNPPEEAPINDGGPAFPTEGYDHPNHGYQFGSNGMSLRDWFAGAWEVLKKIKTGGAQ